jgi:hypothetical protein
MTVLKEGSVESRADKIIRLMYLELYPHDNAVWNTFRGKARAELEDMERELAEARAFISDTPTWIPVGVRLPPDREWHGIKQVLAFGPDGVFLTQTHPDWWNKKDLRGYEFNGPTITHWMPLPDGPK